MSFIQNGKFYSTTPVHVRYNITNGYWNEPGFILYPMHYTVYVQRRVLKYLRPFIIYHNIVQVVKSCLSKTKCRRVCVCVCFFLGGGGGGDYRIYK